MTARDFDLTINELARRQHSWFSSEQIVAAGGDRGHVKRRVDAGLWIPGHPGVFGLAWARPSFFGELWAAQLAAGPDSYVSHEAAAHLHGLTGFPRPRTVVTVPHPLHLRVPGVVVHQLTDTALHEFVEIEGLRVTTVAWTFVDIAAIAHKARVGVGLEDAIAAKLVTATEVGQCLALVARPHKPGAIPLARLLNRYTSGGIPASKLERILFGALEAAGEPLPIPQHPHPGRHPTRGCADGCHPDAKLIVEADGRPWHTRIADVARDRARDNEASRAGYLTLRFISEMILNDIDDVVATIRETRLGRLALFAAASRGRSLRNPQRSASAPGAGRSTLTV